MNSEDILVIELEDQPTGIGLSSRGVDETSTGTLLPDKEKMLIF